MAYPHKHKQETMDFFDKMQQQMQVEDSKRRKLSKESTSSQPELMFLQFKPTHGKQCSGNKPQYMSQQTTTKKTWTPPTKVCPNEPSAMDVVRKTHEKQFCSSVSSTFVKDSNKINEAYTNENKHGNYVSQHEDPHSSYMAMIQENTNKVIVTEKAEMYGTELEDQIKNVAVYDLDVCREENYGLKCELRRSTCTTHDYGHFEQSNLLLEKSNKVQLVQSSSNYNDECISDQDDIPTQRNPNLSKELDSSYSETSTQINSSDIKSCEDRNKEISDNEDIQLINSIDLILSENQENQYSQSESISENYTANNISHKNKNSSVVESQCYMNEMSGEFAKVDGKLAKCETRMQIGQLRLHTDGKNEIASNLTTSNERSQEKTQMISEIHDNNEIVSNTLSKDEYNSNLINDHNETSEIESTKHRGLLVCNNQNLHQSDGFQTYPDSLSCIEKHENNSYAQSGSSEAYDSHTNVSEIIQKAIKQTKIDYFCKSEEHDNVERRVVQGSSQSVAVQDENEDNKGVNKVAAVKNDEEHESVCLNEAEEVKTLIEKLKNGENKTVKISDGNGEYDDGCEENKTEVGEVKGVNNMIDPSEQTLDDEVNKLVPDDNDEEGGERKQKLQPESELLYDEDKNGFDDDYSCLMISNSQLMELERKYCEVPDNLKPPVEPITTQSKNCLNPTVNTRSIGVQTESGVNGMLPSNLISTGLPPTTAPTAQWTNRIQETQRQLRDTIREVDRLNAILMKIRKDLWPQRNMKDANKF